MSSAGKKATAEFLRKNSWLLVILFAGLLLLLMPSGEKKEAPAAEDLATEQEARLARALSRMEGVGEVYVLLSEKPGREEGYSGAVILCAGAADPGVQLRITESVAAFTGLGSNKIVIQKMIS